MSKKLQTKKEAIETVKENNYGYYELGFNFAVKWVAEKMHPFTSEDLSKDMYLVLGYPEEPRVLGAIIQKLSKEGRIKAQGWTTYKAIQGHGKPARIWISKEYSLRQAENRKLKHPSLFEND